MIVRRLTTTGFRNLLDDVFSPCEQVNVIYGDNAQGKTNLLEALWLFTGGHSFRGAKDHELPRLGGSGVGAASAVLRLDFYTEGRDQTAELTVENGKRGCTINGVKKKTASALVGKVRAVIFSPEHLLLVKEGPSRRRNFLDGALCQLKPGYAVALSRYNRALLQRNALLKDLFRYPDLRDTVEVWDARLADLGAVVLRERGDYVIRLAPEVGAIYEGISKGREAIAIAYSPSLGETVENLSVQELSALFREELQRTLNADIRAGFTTVGPHRDDLEITLGGVSARSFGSQGQQRSCVLALKLAEAETLARVSGETPIVLLDDVMSELDQSRQDYLLNHLHGRQVFITCCSPETVSLQETGKRFRVEGGRVTAEEL